MEIPKISDTRWVCRYAAVRLLKESLIEAFEAIIHMMGVKEQKPLDFLHSFKFFNLLYSCGCLVIFLGSQNHSDTL